MICGIIPLNATINRALSLRNATSREGYHISVVVFGKYPLTDDVMFFVIADRG